MLRVLAPSHLSSATSAWTLGWRCSRAWDRRWPLHLVRARPPGLWGQACWAHLYLLCLFSLPVLHHPSACPQGSPLLTPDLMAGVPCHPFANRDITFQLLKFKPDECFSWSEGWGTSGSSSRLSAVCLGADGSTLLGDSGVLALSCSLIMSAGWCSSLHLANRYKQTRGPELFQSAAPSTTPVSVPDISLTPSNIQHSTPNPPFCLTLLHTHTLFYLCETGLKQNDFTLSAY